MKRLQTCITDLSFDLLKIIISFVALSPNGARNITMVQSVCKVFKEICESKDILSLVEFDNIAIDAMSVSFYSTKGLFYRCLTVKNLSSLNKKDECMENLRLRFKECKLFLDETAREFGEKHTAVEEVNTRARLKAFETALEVNQIVFYLMMDESLNLAQAYVDMVSALGPNKKEEFPDYLHENMKIMRRTLRGQECGSSRV